jgi:protein-S-isoprenylcysteine O-methyltransferase Ste14
MRVTRVRHPEDVKMIGFFAGVPFLLGSWAGLVPVAAGVAHHVLRTALEVRMFPG